MLSDLLLRLKAHHYKLHIVGITEMTPRMIETVDFHSHDTSHTYWLAISSLGLDLYHGCGLDSKRINNIIIYDFSPSKQQTQLDP